MSTLAVDISTMLRRELRSLEREIELFPDDQHVWRTLPGVTNSAGNLAMHVAGNLQYFVGAVLGRTGYRRNRELEFSRRSGTKQEVIGELQAADGVVSTVLPALTGVWYDQLYPEVVFAGKQMKTGRFLLHLCTHAAFHLGQVGYLRRVLTGDATSSGGVALGVICE